MRFNGINSIPKAPSNESDGPRNLRAARTLEAHGLLTSQVHQAWYGSESGSINNQMHLPFKENLSSNLKGQDSIGLSSIAENLAAGSRHSADCQAHDVRAHCDQPTTRVG